MADPTTLEQRTVALQCLIGAKRALGMDAEAFALWLSERAHEIAPDLFKVAEDLAREERKWDGRTVA